MGTSNFDPAESVTFDLQYGHVHLDGAPTRVMVPADGLRALCEAAGSDASQAFGKAMGTAMGRRMRVRLHKLLNSSALNGPGPASYDAEPPDSGERQAAVRELSLEQAVEQLAIELALVGMGALSAERWGRALLLIIDQAPVVSPEGSLGRAEELYASVLGGALSVATAMAVETVALERDGVRGRYLVTSPSTAESVRRRLQGGESWGTLLVEMHGTKS